MAGRDRSKLERLARALASAAASAAAAAAAAGAAGSPPGILVADVTRPDSLLAAARAARVMINAVGPFRFWGRPVVAACVEGGCHYLDICGERVKRACRLSIRMQGVRRRRMGGRQRSGAAAAPSSRRRTLSAKQLGTGVITHSFSPPIPHPTTPTPPPPPPPHPPLSGEPEFIERMELEWDDAARAAGVWVASAVGFDSAPGDVGALWTLAQFRPPARCTSIESTITIRGGPSGFKGERVKRVECRETWRRRRRVASLARVLLRVVCFTPRQGRHRLPVAFCDL